VAQVPPPPAPPTTLEPDVLVRLPTWDVLQETTARLLFMAVRWVRCLVPFQTLSKSDQQLLLQVSVLHDIRLRRSKEWILIQESWKELFLLNFAQWSVPWDLSALLESQLVRDRIPNDPTTTLEMKTIQEILCRFRQISPDSSEVGCMKAVTLFSPGKLLWTKLCLLFFNAIFTIHLETASLCDVQPVEMLQDQAQCILSDHVRLRYPRQPTRFGRLLLLLPSLRAIRQKTIELLFFKETIGSVPISRLLGDMYQMEKYGEAEKTNWFGQNCSRSHKYIWCIDSVWEIFWMKKSRCMMVKKNHK
jgi:nuclear receptor subfamily 2 group A